MPTRASNGDKPYSSVPHYVFRGNDDIEYTLPTAGDTWECYFFDDTAIAMSLYAQRDLRMRNLLFAASMAGRKRNRNTGEYKGKAPHEISQEGSSPVCSNDMNTMYAREDTNAMFLEEVAAVYGTDRDLVRALKPVIRDALDYMLLKIDDQGIPWMDEPCALARVDIKDSGFFGEYEGVPAKYSLLMWIGGISRALRRIAPVVKGVGIKDPDYRTLMDVYKKTQKAMHEHFRMDGHFSLGIADGEHITGIASDYLEALQYFNALTEEEKHIARVYASMLQNPLGYASYAAEQKGYDGTGYQDGPTWPVMNGMIMIGAMKHDLPDIYISARNGLRRINNIWPGVYPEYVAIARKGPISKEKIEELGMRELGDYVFMKAGSEHQLFSEAAIRLAASA